MTLPETPPSHREAIRCAIVDANNGHGMWQESGVVADAAIAALLALGYRVAPGWVACSPTTMPRIHEDVLVFVSGGVIAIMYFTGRDWKGEEAGAYYAMEQVAHWMPLPSPSFNANTTTDKGE